MSDSKPPEERPERGPMPPMPSWPTTAGDAKPSATVTEKPKQVRYAVILMYAGAVLTVLTTVLWFFGGRDQLRSDARRALQQAKRPIGPEDLDKAVNGALTFILVSGIVAIALWIFMALMADRGKGWTRIVATVLAIGNVLVNVLQGLPLPGVVLVIVGIVVAALLWTKPARQWFDGVGSRRISA
ncbi:MAG TPA: hypothetical protein VE287_13285 [Actinopolymorphaceae bacterium]|nr:hypothetical protein [Actinopolymorphaceae bacterium]